MKKFYWLSIIVLICLIFTGCSKSSPTTLRINNSTSSYFQDVQWHGYDFGAIASGYYVVKDVSAGNDYVYFEYVGYWFRTVAIITVNIEQQVVFTLTNLTIIHPLYTDNPLGPMNIGDMIKKLP